MTNIANKIVLITGASSGIGEATARTLATSGAAVVLGARRTDRLEKLAEDITAAGGRAIYRSLDVTSRESVRSFADAAVQEFGRIDVIINNAGIMPLSPMASLKVDEWDRMIDVNIKGRPAWHCSASAIDEQAGIRSDHQYLVDRRLCRLADGRRLLRHQICSSRDLGRAAPGERQAPRHLHLSRCGGI